MGRHGTIAGRKAAQDSKRAAMFTKYAKAITVAAKMVGILSTMPDSEWQSKKLRQSVCLTIIFRERSKKELESWEELHMRNFPSKVTVLAVLAIIVDCLTDNNNRTTSAVRSTFDKHGGNLGTPGCVSYMFSRKGVLILEKTDEIDEDVLMEAALEAGAEDMITEEDSFTIYTDPSAYTDVYQALAAAGYAFVESDVEFVPSMESTPTDEHDIKKLKKLIEVLEDNDDVQKVHTNCAIDLYED